MKTTTTRYYEDFVIGTPSNIFYFLRPLVWAYNVVKKDKSRKYYQTQVRRVGKSKIEVTFDLPPAVKQKMHKAIESGKQIRLFVL